MSFKEKLVKKQKEKREAELVARERELHHIQVLKEAAIEAKKEKKAPEGAYISLCNVNKIYPNHVQAVFDFNIDIKEKEFIVFVGPSGCGKSTTLRMVAGLEEITSGDFYIGGEYANNIPPKDRKIGMVFQSYALFPHMTVYENMAFALQVSKMKKEEIDERVKKAAQILQIEEYLDRKPNALSGGQCQRVALGRAIVANSKIFLMDEPLSNLDAKLRVAMRSEIVKLHRDLNTTTIYVTHDQTEAMTMADRIVVMNKGYVQQIGTPSEIFNSPANMFVATFIGSPSMNMLKSIAKGDEIYLAKDFKLDLGKGFNEKVNDFYRNEIELSKKTIEEWKNTFLNRQLESPRYQKMFNQNEVNVKHAKTYISCLEKEALDSINLDVKSLYELLDKKLNKEQFMNEFNPLLKEYLFAYHKLHNPNIRTLCETLEKQIKILDKEEKQLILGIRPEHFVLANKKTSETLTLKVSVAELLGSEYYVHLPFLDGEIVAKLPVKEEIKENNVVKLDFDKERIHIFDPISTKKLY